VKKLLALKMSLYGRHTTVGYIDYKYRIIVPKEITINDTYRVEMHTENEISEPDILKKISKKVSRDVFGRKITK
jgi:hypothetical protein